MGKVALVLTLDLLTKNLFTVFSTKTKTYLLVVYVILRYGLHKRPKLSGLHKRPELSNKTFIQFI